MWHSTNVKGEGWRIQHHLHASFCRMRTHLLVHWVWWWHVSRWAMALAYWRIMVGSHNCWHVRQHTIGTGVGTFLSHSKTRDQVNVVRLHAFLRFVANTSARSPAPPSSPSKWKRPQHPLETSLIQWAVNLDTGRATVDGSQTLKS